MGLGIITQQLMSEVFEVCEANFYNSIRTVQRILKSNHVSEVDLSEAKDAIKEAGEELNKMDIEYNINRLPEFKSKIDVFKEELRQYKRQFAKKEKNLKDQLMEQASGPLFEQEEALENGVDPLLEAKRQMYENEAMSNEVALNLRKNNEVLIKNINRMGDINNELTVAHKLLNSIRIKMRKNKLVMYGTLIFLAFIIIMVIYTYFGN